MSLLQRTLLAGLLLLVAARTGGAQVLAVPETEQEQSQWCWAAVSAACLSYYANPVAQCVIAEYTRTVATWHDFGDDDCCQVPWGACNYWNYNWGAAGSIEDILDHWSVASYGTGRALSQAEVGDMIADDRPFIIRWGWDGGGGHFLVGHGLVGADLHYMDPWYGEGLQVASYDWVVSGGNHSWTHTNVITEHHCSCHTSDACCDGCDPINEGGGCDDGDACSLSDTCQAGACSGTGAVVCQPIDQCHAAGQCDPASGECSTPELADGTACDDGDACTQTDTCQAGACSGSDAVVCQPIDQCHAAGQCDPASGECSTPELADGTGCDDGDACTQTDTCQAGACSGSDAVVCQPIDQCHAAGQCDPASGECSTPELADGTGCDDGDACTQTDTCQAGACSGSDVVVCQPIDQCHAAGQCDPASGECSTPELADGTGCDDGDACTRSDSCQAGVCSGADPVVCQPIDQCHAAGTCDPASGQCSTPALADGTGCDDGDACTQSDSCQAGVCVGADPVVCQPIDQCHAAGTCDPASGQCSTPALADGTGCDDGDACTRSDSCQAGVCSGADPVICEPLDQCHVAGSCDPQTGSCSQPAAEDGSACDDGNPCTGDDACSSGACTGQALADWTACQPDGACFDAACEYVPAGDRCDDPLLLEPELPRAVSPGEYHRWVGAAPPCTDASHDGADVFFAAAVEPQQRYALRIAADTGAELLAVLRDDCQSLEACPLQEPLVGGDTPVEVLECDFDRSQRAVFQLVLPADAALETLRVELVERDAGGCGCAGGGRPGAGCGWLLLGLLAALLLRRRFMPCPQRGAAAAAKNRAELLRISAGREDSGAW
jgi:hypothetical protein